jgi:hypothetical protein
MEEFGITDRDAFLAHSMNFDLDDNGYLKKAEFVEAAKAFTADAEENVEEMEASEESTDDAEENDESPEEAGESDMKDCPICNTSVGATAMTCPACGFTFI